MPQNSSNGLLRTRIYRKIDRTSAAFKSQRPTKTKILDADIDEFISNLSPDTSDMSDDSDFEFDEAILDKWVAQCKPNTPENESLEFIFDVLIKNMPPSIQYPVLQMKRFVKQCNRLYQANLKWIRAVYFFFSLLLAWIIHFLFILSTSYKNLLLSTYRFIVKVDAWMDRILDDRTVSKQNPMMSDTVRNKIAESMKLSKTPISTRRARELMIHPAASKIRNDDGNGQFWQWLHGPDGSENGREKSGTNNLLQGIPQFDMKFPDMNMQIPDMKLPDIDLKLPDIDIGLPDIDLEDQMKKGKKTFDKMSKGLTSMGNKMAGMGSKFTGMFKSNKKELEITESTTPVLAIAEKVDSRGNIKENIKENHEQKSDRASFVEKSNSSKMKMSNTKISSAKMSSAKLSTTKKLNAELSNAKLSNAKMSNAKLSNAKMSNAKMSNVNISSSKVSSKKSLNNRLP